MVDTPPSSVISFSSHAQSLIGGDTHRMVCHMTLADALDETIEHQNHPARGCLHIADQTGESSHRCKAPHKKQLGTPWLDLHPGLISGSHLIRPRQSLLFL